MFEKIIERFYKRYFLNEQEKQFINFARGYAKKESSFKKKSLLINHSIDDDYFLFKNFFVSWYLKKKKNLSCYYFINFSNQTFNKSYIKKIYSFFIYNTFAFLKAKKKIEPYCDNEVLNYYYVKSKVDYFSILNIHNLSSNKLINYRYKSIVIGDLIIDSYNKYFYDFLFCKDFKEMINDNRFRELFNYTCEIVNKFKDIFYNKNIKYLISPYSTYIEHGIPVRVAKKFNAEIYFLGDLDRAFIKSNNIFHKKNFNMYKKQFNKFSFKNAKIKKADNILKKRLTGVIDEGIVYMPQNSYKRTDESIDSSKKKSVCIFAHRTLDSLFGFRYFLFLDQGSWINFTIKNLMKSYDPKNHNIFFKIHPNETQDGKDFLIKIVTKYKFVQIIDEKCNNIKLINSNLVAGITIHGTIGLELAYHGIPTIFANDNPYVSFRFCKYAKSLKNYKTLLKDIFSYKKNKHYKKEALIFYYMNFLFSPKGLKNQEIFNLKNFFFKNDLFSKRNNFINYLNKINMDTINKKLSLLDAGFKKKII
jgi:hypothetical protein